MMNAKVSIIMPAYNAAGFIRRSVGSILAQSYENLELVVVNDGSKDNTAEVLADIAAQDSRLRPLTVENGGPAMARNHGIAAADPESEYIMFIDSDDELLPDAVEYAVQGAAKGADMTVFGFSIVAADGSVRNYCEDACVISRENFGEEFARIYKANLLNQVWGKLYSAKLIRENKVRFEDYRWGEDRLFIFDCLEHVQSVAILPDCKYLYIMQQGESLITKFYDKKFQVCLEIDKRIQKLCTDFAVKEDSAFRYMFAKSIFSCLTNLFTPSCKLNAEEKRAFVRSVINNEQVKTRTAGAFGGASVKILCALMRTGSVGLNLLAFRAVAFVGKVAPALFIKLKHKK